MKCEMTLGMRISFLDRTFKQQMDLRLKKYGLTGVQICVLGQLIRLHDSSDEEVNQKALERAAHVTHPTMTEIIKRLERGGFLCCEPSLIDRRSKKIVPTDKARRLREEVGSIDREVSECLFEGMSDEQKETLTRLTDIMLHNAFELRRGKGQEDEEH